MMTTTELAEQLGITRQCLNKYRRKLEQSGNKTIGQKQGLYVVLNDDEVQQLSASIPEDLKKVREQEKLNYEVLEPVETISAMTPVRHTVALENQITRLQVNSDARYQNSQDTVSLALQRIDLEAIRSKNTQHQLSEVEKQTAITKGINRAVQSYELEQQAFNAVLEQLKLKELNNQDQGV